MAFQTELTTSRPPGAASAARQGPAPAVPQGKRLLFVDNLRILLILIGFAYAFHVVALYPLLKWGIGVLITIPLCFLISLAIRKIPLVNRVL